MGDWGVGVFDGTGGTSRCVLFVGECSEVSPEGFCMLDDSSEDSDDGDDEGYGV